MSISPTAIHFMLLKPYHLNTYLMLNNVQITTALLPSIFIKDKDGTEHNTKVSINHNTCFDPRAFFHCPIKRRPPHIFCSIVVEERQAQPPDEWASLCERISLHHSEEWSQVIHLTSVSHNGPDCTSRNATASGEICYSELVKYATVKWWNMLISCMETTRNISFLYRVFHNVLHDYKYL